MYKYLSNIIFFILLFINATIAFAKTPELKTTIKEKAIDVQINYSDEIIILQKGLIKKYNSNGELLVTYGNLYINNHTKIISLNTFRTILFCEDFGKIIILDKRFGEVAILDTYNIENYLISTIGISYDNENLWIWDMIKQQLIKINQQAKPIYTTSNVNIYTNTNLQPSSIIEIGTKLYLNDTSKGIFVFDNTGTFKKNIPIQHISSLFIIDDNLFYIKNNVLFAYNFLSFNTIEFTDTPNLKSLNIGHQIITGINANGFVEVWNL